MEKPIIGIASSIISDPKHPGWKYYASREQDVVAVIQASGIPLLMPPVSRSEDLPQLISQLDGLYLAGRRGCGWSFFRGIR
jgi:gamma-glutamyl-gamma-aminobutyrate hydrolase PuuD